MAGRRTNLALLVLLLLALATGLLSWAAGPSLVRWLVIAHGVSGLAIVVIAPWKQSIARRGLVRPRTGRATSIAFVVLILTSIVAAFVHVSGIAHIVGTFSPLGIHVATAFVAVAFAVVHVLQRTVRPRATDLSRRNLLRGSVLLGGAGMAWLTIEGILRATDARGAQRRITGSFETGSDVPVQMPVTQWLNDAVQDLDAASWRLHVTGGARSYSVEDLSAFGDTLRATLDCTGGWYAEQEWRGARLDRLIDGAQGRSILVRSATGYGRRFPLSDLATLLIATEVGGERLSPGHGAPARLVAPGRRGFWWVKWVTTIELDVVPWWWQPPFPLT